MNDRPPTGDQQAINRTPVGDDGPRGVSVADAARVLGLSVDAIRGRLQRGTLPGEKVNGIWQVYLTVEDVLDEAPAGGQQAVTGHRQAATGDPTGGDGPQQATDIAPLVALVEDLTAQVRDLSATAAMWQTRAAHLDDQLKQLSASVSNPEDAQPETYRAPSTPRSEGMLDRLKRWLTGGRLMSDTTPDPPAEQPTAPLSSGCSWRP